MRPHAEIVRPQPVEGVGDEGLHCANPLGCQLRHQHLSMRRMCGVIRGGHNLGGSTERIQLERDDGALGREHHRRGQVRREILGTVDDLGDGLPVADQVEPGVADAVDRPLGAQAIVERIRVLQRIDTEELNRIMENWHF